MQTVFYSWQSDLPNSTNRGFIEDCLDRAIDELNMDGSVRVFSVVDRDTQGETGSPDIIDTIFNKIPRSQAFVADVSFVNGTKQDSDEQPATRCDCTRLTPNPNVMAETGFAMSAIGFERVVYVLNEATGRVEELPFDIRKRSIVTYRLEKGQEKADVRKMLVGKLKAVLKGILNLPSAVLDLQFADPETRLPTGTKLTLRNVWNKLTMDWKDIPSLSYGGGGDGPLAGISFAMNNLTTNPDYYRQKANYIIGHGVMRPISFVVKNAGGRLLKNVRLEFAIEDESVLVREEYELPEAPKTERNQFDVSHNIARGIRPARKSPGDIELTKSGKRQEVVVSFLDIQAKATVKSDVLYLGTISDSVKLSALLYSDELSQPIEVPLEIIFETEERELTMEGLRAALPDEESEDESEE